MSELIIYNGKIYTEDVTVDKGYVHIKDGRIVSVGEVDNVENIVNDTTNKIQVIDVQGHHVLPGFIDIHIHGGYGQDAMDGSFNGLKYLSENLLSEGTTSYLATTMTQSTDKIDQALLNIAKYEAQQDINNAAEIVGIHLEGPFISENKVGAQHPQFVVRPYIDKIKHFQNTANGLIKIMTFAPEVEGAKEALETFKDSIIFSIGHTVATYEEAVAAVEHGAKHVTHLYNAATGFKHREPGVFGAAWLNDALHTEMIVDGTHSHPASVAIAYRLKGNERFYLITDAMRAKGMPEGEYDLGGQKVFVQSQQARLESGALAGSILKMNHGLRNLISFTGDTLENLWRVTSLNQAIALGIDDRKGSIKVDKDADIVIVDDEINVQYTIKQGKVHSYS
ncbi:N-acetylglucosamine-6-phosphate deacetylase [Staphylococcus schweitzeri]|uniref:N-acetylglucosamine-6-phosphate deacetylase n=1 Tax=Staphylococcus schweitzeri TaxID=1654388 RepID=UPI000500D764|nr:N-acetylglucosamine-6-phosphate deacetylase [Staphylococcus schweitzeri]CDR65939.1 N-acetylglucosamine-6-phosphate deacetylase [Staphylococcus schweitzeri]